MAEALSYSQTQDRLLEEFVIGERRVPFDPQEMDLVRLMMMAMDSSTTPSDFVTPPFQLQAVQFKDFVTRVVENTMRRLLREKKEVNKQAVVREVTAQFDPPRQDRGQVKVFLDLVSKPSVTPAPLFLEQTVLPLVAEEVADLFKSYRFRDFGGITVGQYLKKGSTAFVEGRMQTRSWDDKSSGEKKYRTEIVADRVQFGPRPGGAPAGGAGGPRGAGKADDMGEAHGGGSTGGGIEYPPDEINPDDIPF
jgi:hypothetical protein